MLLDSRMALQGAKDTKDQHHEDAITDDEGRRTAISGEIPAESPSTEKF